MKEQKRKKILFMLPTLGAGGAERILVTLLNNIDRNKFDPIFLALNETGPIKEWISQDVPFYSFGKRSVKGSVLQLIRFIKEHKPDVLFTTMVHSNALALLMKILFPKMRVVIREAALPSVLVSRYGWKGRMCILVYKFLYPFADLVVSNCSQMVDDFRDKIKIDTSNHEILFNPVDIEKIYKDLPETIDSTKNDKDELSFVAVGRLSYEKGYDRLLEALSRFQSKYNWRLDIVGEGAYEDHLKKEIKRYKLQNNVFLVGYKSNPWIVGAKAHCLLLPSLWEGMPNVVLEGFACGVPAIATREAGGIVDIKKFTPDEHLKVVNTMDEFLQELEKVKPVSSLIRRDSILPKEFQLPVVVKQFETILDS